MVILPAGDGDVVTNDGARFYDRARPYYLKTQLYVHRTNHNFFNTKWPQDDGKGPAVIPRPEHQALLSAYGAALFRRVFFTHNMLDVLTGAALPPGASAANVQVSSELRDAVMVDDNENPNINLNTLREPNTQTGGLTAQERDFRRGSPAAFNNTFFGNTIGMVARSTAPTGRFRLELGRDLDITRREIWVRAAEIYNGSSVPAGATGFELGLEDASGRVRFVNSSAVGGLPRPYNRRSDDMAHWGTDFTKTMPKTLRFPAACFTRGSGPFDIRRVQAILIRLNRTDRRPLAFDQLQIVALPQRRR
jgi:hypothetical protein